LILTIYGDIVGYTIYFKTEISRWNELKEFLVKTCHGIGFYVKVQKDSIIINPGFSKVEPLIIMKKGSNAVKTYGLEPYTSLYKLILYSLSSFGSVEIFED